MQNEPYHQVAQVSLLRKIRAAGLSADYRGKCHVCRRKVGWLQSTQDVLEVANEAVVLCEDCSTANTQRLEEECEEGAALFVIEPDEDVERRFRDARRN